MATKFNTHAATFLLGMEKMKNGRGNYDELLTFLDKEGLTTEDLQAAQRAIQAQVLAKGETAKAGDMIPDTASAIPAINANSWYLFMPYSSS